MCMAKYREKYVVKLFPNAIAEAGSVLFEHEHYGDVFWLNGCGARNSSKTFSRI